MNRYQAWSLMTAFATFYKVGPHSFGASQLGVSKQWKALAERIVQTAHFDDFSPLA